MNYESKGIDEKVSTQGRKKENKLIDLLEIYKI